MMTSIEKLYFTAWLSLTVIASYFLYSSPSDFEFLKKSYWKTQLVPWKIATFLTAITIITVASPYTGDTTWDYVDSILISIDEFLCAPWSIAILYRSYVSREFDKKFFVAFCAFFSPCWIYDIYILWRDNVYPSAWLPNIGITSAITLAAGLFWNLSWNRNLGVHFGFSQPNWPSTPQVSFIKILWPAILLSIPVLGSIAWFLF